MMAIDKAIDSAKLDSDLTAVADAIRTKGGTSAPMAFPDGFVQAVQAIEAGTGGGNSGGGMEPIGVCIGNPDGGTNGYGSLTLEVITSGCACYVLLNKDNNVGTPSRTGRDPRALLVYVDADNGIAGGGMDYAHIVNGTGGWVAAAALGYTKGAESVIFNGQSNFRFTAAPVYDVYRIDVWG